MRASAPDLTFRAVRKRKQERLRPCLNAGQSRLFLRPYAGKTGGGGRKTEKIIPYPSHTMECACGGLQTFAP